MNRPKLHVTPFNNWINDPNGFIYFNNEYHLFYQYFPYEPYWGTMHWGHKVSKDLVHFKDLGIALYPSKVFDKNGVWSGSAIEKDGKMHIYYTGVQYEKATDEDIHRPSGKIIQSQAMIISEDGYTFDNHSKKQIIPSIADPEIGDYYDARDPKVFKYNDQYYIVLGTKHDHHGRLLIYTSKDAINWSLLSINDSNQLGTMLECPDLYQVNGKWFMTASPIDKAKDEINYPNNCYYLPVDFDGTKVTFKEDPILIDLGMDYYAGQSCKVEDQMIIIGWMRMPVPMNDFNGMYTYPRIMEYKNHHLYYHVHPNVDKEFIEECESIDHNNAYKISCDVCEGSYLNIAGYSITVKDHRIYTDRSKVFGKYKNVGTVFHTPIIEDPIHLEIYLDLGIIEIYINDGYYVLSNIIYNQTNELEIKDVKNLCIKKAK